jgi:type VI secretion system secreted protein VgrG
MNGAGNQPRFTFSEPGFEVLGFSGSEGISELYAFEIDLVTRSRAIDFSAMVGRPARLTIAGRQGTARHVVGVIVRFEVVAALPARTVCRAVLGAPQFTLTLRRKLRVFQDLSVQQIVSQVLQESGISALQWKLRDPSTPRNYCVQYRETDLAFISRLLAEEGIAYHFVHAEDQVQTVFTDHNAALATIAGEPQVSYNVGTSNVADQEVVTGLGFGQRLVSGKVHLRDYNFRKPRSAVEGVAPGVDPSLEVYDYPGEFVDPDLGQRLAGVRLEQLQRDRRTGTGTGTCVRFVPGFRFTLGGSAGRHPWEELNQEYLLVRVSHAGRQGAVLGEEGEQGVTSYSNSFTVIPAAVPFRPARDTQRPVAVGVHTATVLGPPGEQIYVDPHGRVKVRFHWDREDKATSWVRVSQEWAGVGYGSLYIPRVGQEVLVSFLEGDPDRPVITGRVYNGEQVVPYALGEHKTRSTIRSNSSPAQGASFSDVTTGLQSTLQVNAGYNELRFEDAQGKEEVYLHAQRDQEVIVRHDRTTLVKHDRSETVKHDQRVTVGHDNVVEVANASAHGAKVMLVQATEKLTLKVGGSAIVLKPDSIKIGSGEILSSATATNDLRGGLMKLNCGPAPVVAGAAAAAKTLVPPAAPPAPTGAGPRAEDAFERVQPQVLDKHKDTAKYDEALGELFVDGPSASDVDQGSIGDCWLMCSIAAVAQKRPDLIEGMFTRVEGSSIAHPEYQVAFHGEEKGGMLWWKWRTETTPSTVIDRLVPKQEVGRLAVKGQPETPLYSPLYGTSTTAGETWVSLLEKAYADTFGKGKGYEAISNGGSSADAMAHMTGGESTSYFPFSWYAKSGGHWRLKEGEHVSKDELWDRLKEAQAKGYPTTVSSYSEDDELSKGSPLVSHHCYTVMGVSESKEGARTVQLRNPWGGTGTAGEFSMPFDQFAGDVYKVTVNRPPAR